MSTNPRFNAIYTVAENDLSDITYKNIDELLPGVPSVLTGQGIVQVDSGSLSLVNPLGNFGDVLTTIDNFGNVAWAPSSGGGSVPITEYVIPVGTGPSIQPSSMSIRQALFPVVGDVLNFTNSASEDFIGVVNIGGDKTLLLGANLNNDPLYDKDIIINNRGSSSREIKILNSTPAGLTRSIADTNIMASTAGNSIILNSGLLSLTQIDNNNLIMSNNGIESYNDSGDTKFICNTGKIVLNRQSDHNATVQLSSNGIILKDNKAELEIGDNFGCQITETSSNNKIYCDSGAIQLVDGSPNSNTIRVDTSTISMIAPVFGKSLSVNSNGIVCNLSYTLPQQGNSVNNQILQINAANQCSFVDMPLTYMSQTLSWNAYNFFNYNTDESNTWYKTTALNSTVVAPLVDAYNFGAVSFSIQTPGTYLFTFRTVKSSDSAIVDFSVNSVITGFDLYKSGSSAKFMGSFTRVLTTVGTYSVGIVIDNKNASSSGFKFTPVGDGITINRIA